MRFLVVLVACACLAFFFCSAGSQEVWHKHPDGVYRRMPPNVISPSAECSPNGPHVLQPSSPSTFKEMPCSPVQAIVSEPMQGTGLRLPIGNFPSKIDHKLDPDQMELLKKILSSKVEMPKVDITPRLEEGTSQQLSLTCQMLQVLLALGSVYLSGSMVGKVLPWVVPVARGLLSLSAAVSQQQAAILAGSSSIPLSQSSAGNPVVHSSTQNHNTSSA